MSEPAICRRLQSSAAVLANKSRILLTFGETKQTECSRFMILCSQSLVHFADACAFDPAQLID
jgi:hypothetical protein